MDLVATAHQLKPVRGQRLAEWLRRFLAARPEDLSRWTGSWTEVNAAKAVEILRKRGVVEEYEVADARFGELVNAVYRAPACPAE